MIGTIEVLVEEAWMCKFRTRLGTPTNTVQDREGGPVYMVWENVTVEQVKEVNKIWEEDDRGIKHYIRHLARPTL